jgi:general secretion pathway protein D
MQKTPMYRTSRTALALMAVASAMPVTVTVVNAGEEAGYSPQLSGLAQREMIRRQEAVADGDRLLNEGREAYAKGDFQEAVDKYRQALDRIPEAPLLADRRRSITLHLTDASVALAQQHRKVGRYREARQLLDGVLSDEVDPNNPAALAELGYLDDPIRTNTALTYEHTQNVDRVRRGLYTAEGAFNLGKYDEARREYENVLRIDPYNSAARRGLEKISAAKSDYYRAAFDHNRAELLMEVDRAWELAVPVDPPNLGDFTGATPTSGGGALYITEKLRRIIIPRIDFQDTTVEEAVEYLRQKSVELDFLEPDPAKKGVNFVIRRPSAPANLGLDAAAGGGGLLGGGEIGGARIGSLNLTNVPLNVALKYITDLTRLRYKVDDHAVILVPGSDTNEDLLTRTFRVPPGFQASIETGGEGGAAAEPDPFADVSAAPRLVARRPIIEVLRSNGITFGDGASASLTGNNLLVTNTPTELDKIDQLVTQAIGTAPRQVTIQTKFIEISQENSDELGFDWIVSPFGLSANSVFGTGGTIGSGSARTPGDFINPVGNVNLPGIPANPAQNVSNIVTGGLRSGDSALSRNNIDALLNNPSRTAQSASVAPGILGLTGLFSDGQVQMIMRGLAQKKGTDLMTAPSVTTRSGQKANIEIIREFIYPTEYEPPELPNTVGATGGIGGGVGGGGAGIFPVTPATPTAFETRNTGVMLEIEPTIDDNNFVCAGNRRVRRIHQLWKSDSVSFVRPVRQSGDCYHYRKPHRNAGVFGPPGIFAPHHL